MTQYTINLTSAEDKALRSIAVDPQEWIENFVSSRCETAINEIVAEEVKKKLALGQSISGSKDEIVLAADIKSAAQIQADFEASLESE